MKDSTSQQYFLRAMRAFGEQDLARAHQYMTQAQQDSPDHLVYHYATRYLAQMLAGQKADVYESGIAFAAFIRGGGNIGLYEATVSALRRVYQEYSALRLLDVGVGDGKALIPALTEQIQQVDVVEPSAPMLQTTCDALTQREITFRPWNCTFQEFVQQAPDGRWDVAQASFSLQSIPVDERSGLLSWLKPRCPRLLLVEFDVPAFTDAFADERILHVLERYQHGLAEYTDTREEVAMGFLMPMMFGYADPTQARLNYEHPIQQWSQQLQDAGYSRVHPTLLYPYWWADAYLLDANV